MYISDQSQLPSATWNSLNYGLQVYFHIHMIVASKYISQFTHLASQVPSSILLYNCLQSDCSYIYISISWNWWYINLANRVIVTMTSLIDIMTCGYAIWSTTVVRILHQVSQRATQRFLPLMMSPTDLLSCYSSSNIMPFYMSTIVVFYIPVHNSQCFQIHLRTLMQCFRAFGFTSEGLVSIWNHLGVLVTSTAVLGRYVCGFWTDLHFANACENFTWNQKHYTVHIKVISHYWL